MRKIGLFFHSSARLYIDTLSHPERGLKTTNDVIDGMMKDPLLAKLSTDKREILRTKLLANLLSENGSVTVLKSLSERLPRSTQVRTLD